MSTPRGRYAPTPSGWLHLGNARTALAAWLSIRGKGGTFVWRLEDLDGPRTVPGMAEAAEEDLRWLGLDWDEGPDPIGGPYAPYIQSQRAELYEAALERLAKAGRLFPCRVSRADLANLATAPHGRQKTPPYPASLRPKNLESGWFGAMRANPNPDAALRFRVDCEPVSFVDRICGPITERVDQTVGDFVLERRDGVYAYQLAVVVDDLAMGITEVVRGRDLLDSTARQVQLIEALGGSVPSYAHLPLVVNAEGEKLSKRDDALRLRTLRESGIAPEEVVGKLGASLGLLDRPEPCRAEELVPLFRWERVPGGD
ncbi:MAG: tRNA glutamyl-Q(34) synthetase GluQRS [Acidobacteriota bacterium]